MTDQIPHFEGITDGAGASCCLKHRGEPILHYQAITAARTAIPVFTALGWLVSFGDGEEGEGHVPTELELYAIIKDLLDTLIDASDPAITRVNGPYFSVWKDENWDKPGQRSATIALELI